jgi:uncharacterized protein with ParB-like and HNH nuclease domain
MKPSKQSLFELFDRQCRYVVPLFQRPYVWSRTDQWEPLWEASPLKHQPPKTNGLFTLTSSERLSSIRRGFSACNSTLPRLSTASSASPRYR